MQISLLSLDGFIKTIKGSIVCPQFAIRLVSSQHSSEGLRVTNYEAILGNLSGGVSDDCNAFLHVCRLNNYCPLTHLPFQF